MKKILVIDDEEFILEMVVKSLNNEGYEVFGAKNLKKARSIIKKEIPDLVITDVMVPYLGGFELVDEIKSNPKTKNTPVILITGMDKEILSHTKTSAEACLTKPFTIKQIIEEVNKLLREYDVV